MNWEKILALEKAHKDFDPAAPVIIRLRRPGLRPELLQMEVIPYFLHGVNPRTLMGKQRWETIRHIVYDLAGNRCEVCGDGDSYLHAHETYEYDYKKKISTPSEVVALCKKCHQFIHINGVEPGKQRDILVRGIKLLNKAGLPTPGRKCPTVVRRHITPVRTYTELSYERLLTVSMDGWKLDVSMFEELKNAKKYQEVLHGYRS
jgi:hypothetical protein